MTTGDIILSGVSTLTGVLLTVAYDAAKERWRFRQELKANNNINLSGANWIAAWQASVNGEEVINVEELVITQKGGLVKIHNNRLLKNPPISRSSNFS